MIGIIGAMEVEVRNLTEAMTDKEIITRASMEFHKGLLAGKPAVVVRSGVGKVNAGICAQILVDLFQVDSIINTGIAGSLDASIDIGDIVLSTDAVQHDMDVAVFGYAPGVIPSMSESFFPASENLRNLAKAACEKVNPDIHVFTGRIVSGDQFICDSAKKEFLCSTFHPMCTEMEGAAIAQAAYLNNVPYLIVRAISDKADGSAEMDYPTFEAAAAEHSLRLVMEMVANM